MLLLRLLPMQRRPLLYSQQRCPQQRLLLRRSLLRLLLPLLPSGLARC
jgi:hypothetical protein